MGLTHGGTYDTHGRDIHTEGTYKWKGHTYGRGIHMKEQTYGETYIWWSVHTVKCIHGGDIYTWWDHGRDINREWVA